MSEGMNLAILLGNVGADPELRSTQGGQAVLNMRMATTETWFDKEKQERQERTEWHNVVVWGKRGEALSKIIVKGTLIQIQGSIRTSSYDDRDGVKRYKTEVHAQNVLILNGGRRTDDRTDGPPQRSDGGRNEPRTARAPRQRTGPAAAPPKDFDEPGAGGGDDDLPY